MKNFKPLPGCYDCYGCTGRFESYLVPNPENRFPRDEARLSSKYTDLSRFSGKSCLSSYNWRVSFVMSNYRSDVFIRVRMIKIPDILSAFTVFTPCSGQVKNERRSNQQENRHILIIVDKKATETIEFHILPLTPNGKGARTIKTALR